MCAHLALLHRLLVLKEQILHPFDLHLLHVEEGDAVPLQTLELRKGLRRLDVRVGVLNEVTLTGDFAAEG